MPVESRLGGARSYLYVPGLQRDRLGKAVERGADAIVADLEDAVLPRDKQLARETVAGWLDQRRASKPQVWVRINPGGAREDIEAIAGGGFDGVMVAKAELDLLADVDGLLAEHERRLGLAHQAVRVIALIETATGLLDLTEIARQPRMLRLAIGEADLSGELGILPGRDAFMPLRLGLVVASAAARIEAPIGPVSTDFRDLSSFAESTRALRADGFRARSAIHPAQVPVINEAFTPSENEVAASRRLVARLDESGSGVVLDEDGRMVDEAVVRAARSTLSAAAAGRPNP